MNEIINVCTYYIFFVSFLVPNIKLEPETRNTEEKLPIHPAFQTKSNAKEVLQKSFKDNLSVIALEKPPFQATKIILGSKPNKNIQISTLETDLNDRSKLSLAQGDHSEIIIQEKKLRAQRIIHTETKETVKQISKYQSPKESISKAVTENSTSLNSCLNRSFEGTKIILGSKPNKTAQHTEDIETSINKSQSISLESVVRVPKVLLQDLGEYIYHSSRYCENCRTLFSTKSDFYVHQQNLHSKDRLNKSTISKATSNGIARIVATSEGTNHKNDENAIGTQNKSLNVKVTVEKKTKSQKNTNKCTICGLSLGNRLNLYKHYKNVHKKKLNIKHTYTNKTFTCKVCGSYFSSSSSLSRHCKNIHKTGVSTFKHNHNSNRTLPTSNRQYTQNRSDSSIDKIEKKLVTKNKNLKVIQEETRSGNNTNKCNTCGSTFSNRANLHRHYKNIHKKKISLTRKRSLSRTIVTQLNLKIDNSKKNSLKSSVFDSKKSCFHCNDEFADQESLIEHMYKVLEPKDYPDIKRRKNLPPEKEKDKSVSIKLKRELANTTTDKINSETDVCKKLKDKLVFEYEDSDEIECPPSEGEQIEIVDFELKLKRSKHQNLEKDQTLLITGRELNAKDYSSSEPLTNKSKRGIPYLSNSVRIVRKRKSTDVNETEENKASSATKKIKSDTECIDSTRSKVTIKTKLGLRHQHSTKVKNKKSKSKMTSSIPSHDINQDGILTDAYNLGIVYECIYCSYVLPTSRAYYLHILGKHKVENISRLNKVAFDKQCKYCPSINYNGKARNTHIYNYHYELLTKSFIDKCEDSGSEEEMSTLQNTEYKKIKSFVLKSIVYKCTKCDVHFLSSCVTKDHEKHMEILVNWKCSICKNIFKKHDKYLHLKQHTVSKTLNVCQFNETELSTLIYNCTKCAIHFTEERYLEHYPKCEIETTDSRHCKSCNILIDKFGYTSHEAYHRQKQHTKDIIIMIGDIITATKTQEQNEAEVANKRKRLYEQINCLTYCETCKCYLSDIAISRKAHVESRCSTMVRYTCVLCGLVLTNKSINTHRQNHKKQKNLKLQDFKFFDLKGFQISPPIPEYPRCNNCEIFFVSKNAVNSHICSEMEFFTCQICNIKLSENAFKLHMEFHNYCMPKEKNKSFDKVSILNQHLGTDIPIANAFETIVANNLPEHNKKVKKHSKLSNDIQRTDKSQTDVTKSKRNDRKIAKYTATPNLDFSDNLPNKDISQAKTFRESGKHKHTATNHLELSTDNANHDIEPCTQTITSDIATENGHEDVAKPQQTNKAVIDKYFTSQKVLFSCQPCGIAIDSYDEVVHHCQNHFSLNSIKSATLKICSQCSLQIEVVTYNRHEQLHLNGDRIQFLTFDPTYFTADNNIWTRHIFASVTPSTQKEVIDESIYRHECRIKMKIVQKGASHLTVYKCCQCGNFIDPECLIVHIKEACNKKMKKYPCSICGLPLISIDFRTKHEKIHKRYENVRLKLYNIILINCDTDKNLNTNIINAIDKYVLYQCRICYGVVDKSQRSDHKCYILDLQKCELCGLLMSKDDIPKHMSRHNDLPMYNAANLKVILFGNEDPIQNTSLVSSFSGTVCDYKLYKCSKCEVCVNDKKFIPRHACTVDDSKWKCPKCGFYISTGSIKQHIKLHDLDAEFKTENFKIICFDLTLTISNDNDDIQETYNTSDNTSMDTRETEKIATKTPANNDNSENVSIKEQSNEFAALYKCACSLHFMDENNAKEHAKQCSPKSKVTRQNCSKCSLAFNPKELFSHIIAHHSDKTRTPQYDVIEINAGI